VVTDMDGHRSLIIRAANARQNVIVDASASLRLLLRERTAEGEWLRRIHDLPLVRHQHPIFLLGWNMVHRIAPGSPLYGVSAEQLAAADASLILTMQGLDETTGQTMQARETYAHHRIRWQHRYKDLFVQDAVHGEVMDYQHFHTVIATDPPGQESPAP
jgi:inward rectifier potassium channel